MNLSLSFLVAFILLVILSPVFLILSILSIILNGFPIIYKQKRMGYGNLSFKIYKFRSMVENKGAKITDSNDSRLTYWGKLLRKFKLDELPQLWNIIKGDMSFVGYRPEVPEIVDRFPVFFTFLTNKKPGLTDLSSIIFKNESELLVMTDSLEFYTSKILPIKSKLVDIFIDKDSFFFRLIIIKITLISLLNHTMALKLVSTIIPQNELELRFSINRLLKVEIF